MRYPITVFAAALVASAFGQYTPFPTDNAEWLVQRTAAQGGGAYSISFSAYRLSGDTVINDTLYHKVYETMDFNAGAPAVLVAGLREEDQRVYARRIGYNGLQGGCQWDPAFEVMLYDYTLDSLGDSLRIQHPWIGEVLYRVLSIDSVQVNGQPRRRINCENISYSCGPMPLSYIEGIGSERHLLDPFMLQTYEVNYLLSCFKQEGVFQYSAFSTPPLCDITTVGMERRESGAEWSVQANGDGLLVRGPSADRVRLVDALGRVLHEAPLRSGSALIPVHCGAGALWVQVFTNAHSLARVLPVVVVR